MPVPEVFFADDSDFLAVAAFFDAVALCASEAFFALVAFADVPVDFFVVDADLALAAADFVVDLAAPDFVVLVFAVPAAFFFGAAFAPPLDVDCAEEVFFDDEVLEPGFDADFVVFVVFVDFADGFSDLAEDFAAFADEAARVAMKNTFQKAQ